MPLKNRIDFLKGFEFPDHAIVVDQIRCKSDRHFKSFEKKIVDTGGEGVIIRKSHSPYESGRSLSFLKVKRIQSDEATVIDYQPGTGKHKGKLGALICRLAGEIVFKIGTGFSDAERECPPEIGARITFSFEGLTDGGVPRFARFVTVRNYE